MEQELVEVGTVGEGGWIRLVEGEAAVIQFEVPVDAKPGSVVYGTALRKVEKPGRKVEFDVAQVVRREGKSAGTLIERAAFGQRIGAAIRYHDAWAILVTMPNTDEFLIDTHRPGAAAWAAERAYEVAILTRYTG